MLQYTLIVWLLLLLTGVTTVVEADRGALRIKGVVPEAIRQQEKFDAAESAGLFVGVRSFEDRYFAEVPYAVDDAVDLAHLFAVELSLITPDRVILALAGEPQKEESQKRLQTLLNAGASQRSARWGDIYDHLTKSRKATGQRGVLVVTLATHGFNEGGHDYLVGSDSRRRLITSGMGGGIGVNHVLDEISKAASPRRLVLLDACRERLISKRAGSGPDTESAMGNAFAEAIAAAKGQVVLSGTTLGGYSYDDMDRGNGVFTGAILDGLRGAAPADERHFITVQTLADYVNVQVLQWVSDNRPGHMQLSRGITIQTEGAMARTPLAINPDGIRDEKQVRQQKALDKLRENLGGPITGNLYHLIEQAFKRPLPPDLRDELLTEIEALDGSVRSKGYLVYWVNENRTRLTDKRVLPQEALQKLLDNKGGVITDSLYYRIVQAFERPLPPDLWDDLLSEIMALDGNVRLQRNLAYWVNENSGRLWGEPDPAPEVRPALGEVLLALERSERRLIQLGLAAEGFDAKPADGLFGRQTREAIGKWQLARDKPTTGYLDAETARLLLVAGQGEAETLALLQEAISLYVSGSGKYPRARKLFEEAADSEHPLAVMWLARSYVAGRVGFPEDKEQGQALARDVISKIKDLARNGDREASFLLGSAHHRHGLAVARDHEQAVSWYRRAAEQGHIVAQRNLGVMYETGSRNVPQDEDEAVKWYRASARQGYARAQNDLGWMYKAGRGVDQNDIQAVKWFREAAEQGDARGQFNLGIMYKEGRGVDQQSHSQAAEWLSKAAEQGKADAQFNLGEMYMDGHGVDQSHSEAAKWFRKAADHEMAAAQFNLGEMYMEGRGLEQSDSQAAEWFRKAADLGMADAQFNLGEMYMEGRGLEQSDSKGGEWLRKAANQGHQDARRRLQLGN